MAYDINKKDGTLLVTVADGAVDDSQTTIKLLGRGVANYGEIVAENMVWMMENFANATPPANPLSGQIWYSTNSSPSATYPVGMYFFDGSNWKPFSGFVDSTPPASANEGDLWWDENNDQLYGWDDTSSDWILVGPTITDPAISQDATPVGLDLNPGSGQMIIIIVNGLVVAAWADQPYSPADYAGNVGTINVGGTNVPINIPLSFPSGLVAGLNLSQNSGEFPGGLPTVFPPPVPVGSVQMFAGTTVPSNWLLCDGSDISRTTYANLFSIIGTTYGAGDGATTFTLPDFQGRSPLGAGSGTGLTTRNEGDVGGAETHTLTEAELASHSHAGSAVSGSTDMAGDHSHETGGTNGQGPAGGLVAMRGNTSDDGTTPNNNGGPDQFTAFNGSHSHTFSGSVTIGTSGSDQPHNNMHPFLGINFIIFAGL